MKNRLILVINPRSSGFEQIQEKLISHLKFSHFDGDFITFEIQPTNPMSNAREMAKGLLDGDTILVAGGDGTAHIASNAAALSKKKNLKMKFTGFGNFNDYAHSFSKNNGKAMVQAIDSGRVVAKIRPLEVLVNGEFLRFAPLYSTVGLTAEMAEIFEGKRLRRALKKVKGRNRRLLLSLLASTRFYLKNRKKHTLNIAKITLDGEELAKNPKTTTDLVFLNGPRMARIMRRRDNKFHPESFRFGTVNASCLLGNLPFLVGGLFGYLPLKKVKSAKIEFKRAKRMTIQIEGEVAKINAVKTIEVKISETEIQIL